MSLDLESVLKTNSLALKKYALLLTRSRGDAEDLVQECLARVLSRRDSWKDVRDPKAYLFRILRNIHIDNVTREQHRYTHQLDEESVSISIPATQQEHMEIGDLAAGLDLLPETHREVVVSIGLEGLSYSEAAIALKIPIGTVMSRLSRARKFLRCYMEEGHQGEYPDTRDHVNRRPLSRYAYQLRYDHDTSGSLFAES